MKIYIFIYKFTLNLSQFKLSKKVEFYHNHIKPINTVTHLYHAAENICVGMMFLKGVSFVHIFIINVKNSYAA